MPLTLSCSDHQELERRVRSQSLRADDVRRARLLLLLADGESYSAIQTILGCSSAYISRWKKRFEAAGLSGLHGRQQGRQATVLTPALEAQILEKTRQRPSDGSTHWSTRKLAEELGVRHPAYNLEAKPIKWKYSDPSKRIQTTLTSSGTGH